EPLSGHAYRRRGGANRRRNNNHNGNGNGKSGNVKNGNVAVADEPMVEEFEDEAFDADAPSTGEVLNLSELKRKTPEELSKLAESVGLEGAARLRKQDMIFAILKAHARNGQH